MAMKNLLKLTITIVIAILLTSCNTQKQLQKAINKNGQRESVGYIIAKYPEYFQERQFHDTIRDTIKVVVEKYVYDTIIQLDSTSIIENENLKITITRLGNGKISVRTIVKEKVVQVPYEKVVTVSAPCPDIAKLQLEPKKSEIQVVYKWWSWVTWIIIALYILWRLTRQKIIERLNWKIDNQS